MSTSNDGREGERGTEAALLAGLAAGSEPARRALWDRYARLVHGILVARVGADDADDLTQEAFLRLYRAAPELEEAERLPGFVAAVARNLATDHLRRRGRRPETEPLAAVPEPTANASADERSFTELKDAVMHSIRSLPEAYAETLVLRLVEGLTGPEIATRTGLTPGSVRVNLCRGMAQLRPLLEKEGWS